MRNKHASFKDNIEGINEKIKLMQYRLTRIVSTGIEHFEELKVSHVHDMSLEIAKKKKEGKEGE